MPLFVQKFRAGFGLVLIVGIYLTVSAFLSSSLSITDTSFVLPYRSAEPHWSPKVFKAITLGHWPILIDTFWIRVLVDPSINKVDRNERSAMFYDLYSASELDAGYFDLHFFGGNLLSIIRGDVEGARLLLERARDFQKNERMKLGEEFIRHFWPAPYSISISLAYLQLYELDNFEEGAKILEETANVPGAPVYLKYLVERLRDPVRATELGIRITQEFLHRSPNELAQKRYEERLHYLEVAHFVFQLNALWQQQLKINPKTSFSKFLSDRKIPLIDPWGGALYISEKNQVETRTVRQKVFGL